LYTMRQKYNCKGKYFLGFKEGATHLYYTFHLQNQMTLIILATVSLV
jgi:hypothetical protein